MNSMFYGCSLLTILPNISQWKINNLIDIDFIFDKCDSLNNIS